MILNYENIFSNLKPGQVRPYGADAGMLQHWRVLDGVRPLEKSLNRLQGSLLCWKLSAHASDKERLLLDIARRSTLTYVLLPDFPRSRINDALRAADPHVIGTQKTFRDTLVNMSLALKPSAWELPVRVTYEKDLNELLVQFANDDLVRWDVLRLPQYHWDTAFVDIKNEPFAIGVMKRGIKKPVFFSSLDVRRDTNTLPPKSLLPHALTEEDIAARAKEYGDFLRQKIKGGGFTQDEFAKKAGIAREQLNRLLNGHHFPRIMTLRKFAKVLKVDVKGLLRQVG